MPRRDKVKYILLMMMFYLGLYVLVQAYVTTHEFDFITEFDEAIPFMPQHVWIYHSMLPVIVATMLLFVHTKRIFFTTFWACLITGLVLNISYVFFPSFYPRPEFEVNTLSEAMVYLTYQVDGSSNTFPSGHVAFAWIMFLGAAHSEAAKRIQGLQALYLLWAIGISLSTLTLKQHYIVDVFSGIFLALISFYISRTFIQNRIAADN
tara:strand:+ start:1110 stop:1730 length:621 start_codon:yes stop_codon:yes gene_type:complete